MATKPAFFPSYNQMMELVLVVHYYSNGGVERGQAGYPSRSRRPDAL